MSLWRRGIRGEQYPSGVPLVGGICGAIGLWLVPAPVVSRFAWLALLLDYGCLPYTVSFLFYMAHYGYIRNRRFIDLQLEGRHTDGTRSVVTLFRNHDCILEQTEMPLPLVHCSTIGTWRYESGVLELTIAECAVRFEPAETEYRWLPTSDASQFDGINLRVTRKAN